MRFAGLALVLWMVPLAASAHPHEWVDWGAGVVWKPGRPATVTTLQLELTWDQWLSELVIADFPQVTQGPLAVADLARLDEAYGLGSPDRASTLVVAWRGRPLNVKPLLSALRLDGHVVTLVYSLAVNLAVTSGGELTVELYDPTFYADMGIRARAGGFFVGVDDPGAFGGTVVFRQDRDHLYFGGTVAPEVVVFSLKP